MKIRKLKNNDYAVFGYFLVFILSAVMLVSLFSFFIPFLIDFSTDMYLAGDDLIANTEEKIAAINNATIRAQIQNNLDNMQSATAENIDYLAFFYQYSWIFIILIITFSIFMIARQTVETKGYAYGGVV